MSKSTKRQKAVSRRTMPSLKKKSVAPPSAAWREPFTETQGPLRIAFRDDDPERKDVKLIQLQYSNGKALRIVPQDTAQMLAGEDVPGHLLLDARKAFPGLSDCEIAGELQKYGERRVSAKLVPLGETKPESTLVTSVRLNYVATFTLLLWLHRSKAKIVYYDHEGQWNVSGYELFHRGVIGTDTEFTNVASPTKQDLAEHPEIYASSMKDETSRCQAAKAQVLGQFADSLSDALDRGKLDPLERLNMEHDQLFTKQWFAKLMAERTGATHVISFNRATGEVQSLLGDEAAADHVVALGAEYVDAGLEGRLQQSPRGLQ